MRAFLFQFGLFSLALLLAMEVFFQVSGLAPELPYARYDDRYMLTLSDRKADSSGWYTYGKLAQIKAPWRINEAGWNSAFDYTRDESTPLVAIIGDSYIENLYCAPTDHLDYLLAQQLPSGFRAYSFGRRGVPMSHFFHMAEYAQDQFAPDWIIYIINHRNVGESVASIRRGRYFRQYQEVDGTIEVVPPMPYHSSQLGRLLSYSAAYRYIMANYTFRIQWPVLTMTAKRPAVVPAARRPDTQELQHRITRVILADLMKSAGNSQVLFVLHPDREAIYAEESPLEESRPMAIVRDELEVLGLPYLSLNSAFAAAYQQDQKPFEFDINDHWNAHANEVAAKAIASTIQKMLADRPTPIPESTQSDSTASKLGANLPH